MPLTESLDLDISRAEAKLATLQKQVDTLRAKIAGSSGSGGSGFINTGDVEKAASATSKLAAGFDKLAASGAKLATAGRALSGLSLPILLAGFAADKAAIKFEDTFLRIQTLTNAATKDLGKFRDATLNLAGTFGRGPQELAEALFFITSNGIQGAKALDVLKVSAEGAALQLGTTQVVASNITSIMNAYGAENISAARTLDILVAAEKESKTSAAELITQYGRLLPAAQVLGVSFEEVSGILAFFTRTTGSAAQAGTQLSNILNKLIKPSAEAKKVLQSIGVTSVENFNALVRQNGVLNTLQLVFDRLGGNTEKFAKVFGNIRGIAGALQLVGPGADNARAAINRVIDSVGAADKAFAQLQNNPAFQRKQAFAEFQAALIQIGELIIPIGNQILGFGKTIAEAFLGLPQGVQKLLIAFAGLLAILGPTALGIGKVIQGVGTLGSALLSANPAVLALGAALAVGAVAYFAFTSESRSASKAAKEFQGDLQTSAQNLDIEAVATLDAAAAYREYGAAVNEAAGASFKKKLQDKNQVDDLNRLGIGLTEASKITGTFTEQQTVLEKVRRRAIETGEIALTLYGRDGKAVKLNTVAQSKLNEEYIKSGGLLSLGNAQRRIAISGNTDLVKTFEKESQAAQTSTEKLVELTIAGDAQAAAILKTRGEWDKLTPSQQRAAQAQLENAAAGKALQESQQGNIGSLTDAQQAYQDLINAVEPTTQSYKDLTTAVDEAKAAVSAWLNLPIDAAAAQLEWNSALTEFGKSVRESKVGIDESTAANEDGLIAIQRNEKGYQSLAKQIVDTVAEGLKHGKSIDEIKAKYAEQTAQLEQVGLEAGLTEAEMAAYNATLGLTPDAVDTAITATGLTEEQQKLADYDKLLGLLPPDVQTQIKTVGEKDAQAGLILLAQHIKDLPSDALTAVGLTGYPDAVALLQALGLDVVALDEQTAEPTVTVDPKPAQQNIATVGVDMGKLGKVVAKPTVTVDPTPAKNNIGSVNTALDNLGKKVVSPTITVGGVQGALQSINSIITALGRIAGARATVGTGPTSVGGVAQGAVFGSGGIRTMREGGIINGARPPAIGKTTSGAGILWAEPSTHGESYIPHAQQFRSRAVRLTSETARMFGYDLVPRALPTAAGGGGGGVARLSDGHVSELAATITHMSKTIRRLETRVGDVNVTVDGRRSDDALGSALAYAVASAR